MKNMNVLSDEIIADTFPFEKAVNIPDVNIFIPLNKNPNENIIKALWVIPNKGLSFDVNILIRKLAFCLDKLNVNNANI